MAATCKPKRDKRFNPKPPPFIKKVIVRLLLTM
jgi:hypothetical protein